MKENSTRFIYTGIVAVSALILAFLFWLIYFKAPADPSTAFMLKLTEELPWVNASLNGLTTLFLLLGLYAIKQGRKQWHISMMLTALLTSGLFLVSYIIYHHYQGDTPYTGEGWFRPIYFFILITHIILSMGMVPMLFITLFNAFKQRWEKHKFWARLTFPVWLYVSITGIIIYFALHF